jgi:hypothetical protein
VLWDKAMHSIGVLITHMSRCMRAWCYRRRMEFSGCLRSSRSRVATTSHKETPMGKHPTDSPIPQTLKEYIFGDEPELAPFDEQWAKRMEEKFGAPWGDVIWPPTTDMTTEIMDEVQPFMNSWDREFIKIIHARTSKLGMPDARCARTGDMGLIGIDERLFLLIYNAAFLLFASAGFQIPEVIESEPKGMDLEQVRAALIRQMHDAMVGTISPIDETILDKDRLDVCIRFILMAEQFVVSHEIGHLVLNEFEALVFRSDPKIHSYVFGFTSEPGEETSVTQASLLEAWTSELLADRYATKLLIRRAQQSNELGARASIAEVLFFLFHLLDAMARVELLQESSNHYLLHHPPPYWRLEFCWIETELLDPHVKYSGPEPFRRIALLFDVIGWNLDTQYLRKHGNASPYLTWTRDPNFTRRLNFMIAQVEAAYMTGNKVNNVSTAGEKDAAPQN